MNTKYHPGRHTLFLVWRWNGFTKYNAKGVYRTKHEAVAGAREGDIVVEMKPVMYAHVEKLPTKTLGFSEFPT